MTAFSFYFRIILQGENYKTRIRNSVSIFCTRFRESRYQFASRTCRLLGIHIDFPFLIRIQQKLTKTVEISYFVKCLESDFVATLFVPAFNSTFRVNKHIYSLLMHIALYVCSSSNVLSNSNCASHK